ncbi:uncharacterized protein AKAME5_001387100 [Lates japonicus]|uniref:Uncharacterized protein n=1 Tax=Lates japonicus TaxID=270547 RepID=A0AAD3MZ31_LATJO|nr:uncharacterized protein AKAME5_001387100 [Lates japonicus]
MEQYSSEGRVFRLTVFAQVLLLSTAKEQKYYSAPTHAAEADNKFQKYSREEMSSTSSTTAELLSPQRAPLNISEANNSSSELDKDSHFHPLSPQPCDVTHSSEGSLIMKGQYE